MGKEYRNAMTSQSPTQRLSKPCHFELLWNIHYISMNDKLIGPSIDSTSSLPIPPCQKSGGVTESSNLLLVAGSPDRQASSVGEK